MDWLQVIGTIFALAMLYLTFLSYKKREYSVNDLALWSSIWAGFLVALLFPAVFSSLIKPFMLTRVFEVLVVAAFLVLFFLVFRIDRATKRNNRTIRDFVRDSAIKRAGK